MGRTCRIRPGRRATFGRKLELYFFVCEILYFHELYLAEPRYKGVLEGLSR